MNENVKNLKAPLLQYIRVKLILFHSLFILLLLYIVKYFSFAFDTQLYSYFVFVKKISFGDEAYSSQLILDYPLILNKINIIGLTTFCLLVIISVLFAIKTTKRIEFLVAVIIFIGLWFSKVLKFSSSHFYHLLPLNLFNNSDNNFKLYLISNGVLFIIISFLLYFIFIKKELKK